MRFPTFTMCPRRAVSLLLLSVLVVSAAASSSSTEKIKTTSELTIAEIDEKLQVVFFLAHTYYLHLV